MESNEVRKKCSLNQLNNEYLMIYKQFEKDLPNNEFIEVDEKEFQKYYETLSYIDYKERIDPNNFESKVHGLFRPLYPNETDLHQNYLDTPIKQHLKIQKQLFFFQKVTQDFEKENDPV